MSDPGDPIRLDLLASLKKPIQWALGAALLAGAVAVFLPNHYLSEARLLPVETRAGGNFGNLAAAAAAFGLSVPGSDGNDSNFVDILNSRSLNEKLLETRFEYHTRSWLFGGPRLESKTLFDYLGEKNRSRALRKLAKELSASRDLKTRIIYIAADTTSAELSQQVVQKALALLETFMKDKGRTRGGAKALFAEARLAEARRQMDEAEDAWRRFLEINRNYLSISDPSVRLKGARLEAEVRLRQQLVTTLAVNHEQALLEEKNDIPILSLMDGPDLPVEKSRPSRSLIVIAAALAAFAGAWLLENRAWIRSMLTSSEDEGPSPGEELS